MSATITQIIRDNINRVAVALESVGGEIGVLYILHIFARKAMRIVFVPPPKLTRDCLARLSLVPNPPCS